MVVALMEPSSKIRYFEELMGFLESFTFFLYEGAHLMLALAEEDRI